MNASDSVFQRALSNMLTEIFDGPPGSEAYLLNPGDSGLLRQLESIPASAASTRPMPGKTTIAAHIDHVHYGLRILNRWPGGEARARPGRTRRGRRGVRRCSSLLAAPLTTASGSWAAAPSAILSRVSIVTAVP